MTFQEWFDNIWLYTDEDSDLTFEQFEYLERQMQVAYEAGWNAHDQSMKDKGI
jgi:hypothetical protein